MSGRRDCLLIVGSFRGPRSTSDLIGSYLTGLLAEKGFSAKKLYLTEALGSEEKRGELLSCVDGSDIVIFSSPLYIDCQPYLVIRAMEMIAGHRKKSGSDKKRNGFIVITNGGYPEARHNDTVMSIYRNFASDAGFDWLGGLAMGMGAALTVPLVRKTGPLLVNMRRSLRLAADAVSAGMPLPAESAELMARPLVPVWFYSFMARSVAKFFSVTNGAGSIYSQP